MPVNYYTLPQVKGKWDGQVVRFECEKSLIPGNVKSILVYELDDNGKVKSSKMIPSNQDIVFPVEREMCVTRKHFCVCATQANVVPDMQALLHDEQCRVNLVIGQAEVEYSVKYRNGKLARKAWIRFSSNRAIEQGVIGYEYTYGECKIRQEIPGGIEPRVKRKLPMIQIPLGAELRVVPLEEGFRTNLIIKSKRVVF